MEYFYPTIPRSLDQPSWLVYFLKITLKCPDPEFPSLFISSPSHLGQEPLASQVANRCRDLGPSGLTTLGSCRPSPDSTSLWGKNMKTKEVWPNYAGKHSQPRLNQPLEFIVGPKYSLQWTSTHRKTGLTTLGSRPARPQLAHC